MDNIPSGNQRWQFEIPEKIHERFTIRRIISKWGIFLLIPPVCYNRSQENRSIQTCLHSQKGNIKSDLRLFRKITCFALFRTSKDTWCEIKQMWHERADLDLPLWTSLKGTNIQKWCEYCEIHSHAWHEKKGSWLAASSFDDGLSASAAAWYDTQ